MERAEGGDQAVKMDLSTEQAHSDFSLPSLGGLNLLTVTLLAESTTLVRTSLSRCHGHVMVISSRNINATLSPVVVGNGTCGCFKIHATWHYLKELGL